MLDIRLIDLLSLITLDTVYYQVLEKGYEGIAKLRRVLLQSHSPDDSHLSPSDLSNALEGMSVSPLTNEDNKKVMPSNEHVPTLSTLFRRDLLNNLR